MEGKTFRRQTESLEFKIMCFWILVYYLVIEVDQSWKVDHHFYYSRVLFLCHPYLCGLHVMTTLELIFLVAITFEWIFALPLVFILTQRCSLNLEFLKKNINLELLIKTVRIDRILI